MEMQGAQTCLLLYFQILKLNWPCWRMCHGYPMAVFTSSHHATYEGYVGTQLCEADVGRWLAVGFHILCGPSLWKRLGPTNSFTLFSDCSRGGDWIDFDFVPIRLSSVWMASWEFGVCLHTTDGQTCSSGSILGTAKLVFAEYLVCKGVFLFHLGKWLERYHFQLLVHFERIKWFPDAQGLCVDLG